MDRGAHDALLRLAAGRAAPGDAARLSAALAPRPVGTLTLDEAEARGLDALARAWARGEVPDDGGLAEEVAHRWRRANVPAHPGQERIGPRSWASRRLGPEARGHLADACETVVGEALAALTDDDERRGLVARLPPRPLPPGFLPRFVAVLVHTAGRLAGQERPRAACVAEEVALHALVAEAARRAAAAGDEQAREEIVSAGWWEDTDVGVLWSPPGRPDPFPELRTGPVHPDTPAGAWFAPYPGCGAEVHPVAADPEREP
jgi:hypothetical protein